MLFFCAYHGTAPRGDLIERLGLGEKRRVQYGRLSVGQQRRLALAIAVAHEPRVLFLDEPTAGLDVQSRADLHVLMAELRAERHDGHPRDPRHGRGRQARRQGGYPPAGRIAAMGSPRQLTAAGDRRTRISVSTERGLSLQRASLSPTRSRRARARATRSTSRRIRGKSVAAIIAWLDEAGTPLSTSGSSAPASRSASSRSRPPRAAKETTMNGLPPPPRLRLQDGHTGQAPSSSCSTSSPSCSSSSSEGFMSSVNPSFGQTHDTGHGPLRLHVLGSPQSAQPPPERARGRRLQELPHKRRARRVRHRDPGNQARRRTWPSRLS